MMRWTRSGKTSCSAADYRVCLTFNFMPGTHGLNILHMDVRQDNILVLPSDTDAQIAEDFVLISAWQSNYVSHGP